MKTITKAGIPFEQLLKLSLDAIVVLDSACHVLYWNDSTEKLFGYTKEEAIGQNISSLIIPEEYVEKHHFGFQRYMTTKKSNILDKAIEIHGQRKDKTKIPIRLRLSHLVHEGEDIFVGYIHDNSEIADKSLKITQQKDKLEKYIESNLQLENFAYYASHDLKTPLQNIINFSGLLTRRAKHWPSTRELEYLDFINTNAFYMEELIDGLLNFSLVSNQALVKSNIVLADLLADILKIIEPSLEEKKGQITLKLEQDRTIADERLLRQVFLNLLTNAIKFTSPEVSPKIEITGLLKDDHHQFCIADNGHGIPADKIEIMFGLFKSIHPKSAGSGTGIGLALCKKIIEKHDGNIWIESEEGSGSKVFFTIPFI